jgi:poly-gamma-glutamate synthesis protein (capsule biosynthesis protein)
VALVHWGREWHLRPSEDQRRAARDLLDAGFDLVVGSHAHVINPPEIYRDRLIAYCLGNFISDFVPWQTRVGVILKVVLARTPQGVKVVDFQHVPTWTQRDGHLVMPLNSNGREHAAAWPFARRILGPSITELSVGGAR